MLPRQSVPFGDAFLGQLGRNRLVAEPLLAESDNPLDSGLQVIST
jgi:hypothetical protein